MSNVSVIGLGPMGIALAQALISAGHNVTVWNRTASKAEPLIKDGAALAPSVAAAVGASPVVIVCVADYAASHTLLAAEGVAAAIQNKTLVQLSTGSPEDARNAEAWARTLRVDYLDGAILATPSQVGRPDTPVFLAGSRSAFETSEPILKAIAGSLTYMGDAVGAASAWDLATLSCMFGAMFGFFHGARICEAEGLRVDAFGSMVASIAPVIGEMIKQEGHDIHTATYENPQSSMKTCAGSGDLFVRQAREARINAAFPTFASGLFKKAMAAGYENERLAAMIKVLRDDA